MRSSCLNVDGGGVGGGERVVVTVVMLVGVRAGLGANVGVLLLVEL